MPSKKSKSGDFSKPISNIQKRIARAKAQKKSSQYLADLETSLSKQRGK